MWKCWSLNIQYVLPTEHYHPNPDKSKSLKSTFLILHPFQLESEADIKTSAKMRLPVQPVREVAHLAERAEQRVRRHEDARVRMVAERPPRKH